MARSQSFFHQGNVSDANVTVCSLTIWRILLRRNPFFIKAMFQTKIFRPDTLCNEFTSRNPFFIKAMFQTEKEKNLQGKTRKNSAVAILFSSRQCFRRELAEREREEKLRSRNPFFIKAMFQTKELLRDMLKMVIIVADVAILFSSRQCFRPLAI